MFKRIKRVNSKTRVFQAYRPISKYKKPYFETFGQVSSKSNVAFGSYVQKCSFKQFLSLIPYNPTNLFIGEEKKIFQKILQMILRLVSIHFQHYTSLMWKTYLQLVHLSTNFWSLGFSRKAYGFTLVRPSVRPCVRHTISGDPRIRF